MGGVMREIVFITVFLSSFFAWGDCDLVLNQSDEVTEKLWKEAMEAERDLFSLRLASKVLISQSLSNENLKLNFKDKSGKDVGSYINREKLVELITACTDDSSDMYHFGRNMELPTLKKEPVNLEKLALEVSQEIPVEQIIKFSTQIADKILALNAEGIPGMYLQISQMLNVEYKGDFSASALRKSGTEYKDIYAFKHDFIEISNYTSRLKQKAHGEKTRFGFLPKDNSPDPEKKNPIGFIH